MSVTDRERNQVLCKVVLEAFTLKKALLTGFILCMTFMEIHTLTVCCQQNKGYRRIAFSDLIQKNAIFLTEI